MPQLNICTWSVPDLAVNGVSFCLARVQAFLLLQVSWIRRLDFHILTTGVYTYTTDMRFSVLHPEGSDDWTLQIKYAEERDNGTYECQVSGGVTGAAIGLPPVLFSRRLLLHLSSHRWQPGTALSSFI